MNRRHSLCFVLLLAATVAPASASSAAQRDDVPMTLEQKASAKKQRDRKAAPEKPPLAKSQVQLRFDFTLTAPASRTDLEQLAAAAPSTQKDAFLHALLGYAAPRGSREIRLTGCCMRLRYAGCVHLCCGSRQSSCQDSCGLLYCEAK